MIYCIQYMPFDAKVCKARTCRNARKRAATTAASVVAKPKPTVMMEMKDNMVNITWQKEESYIELQSMVDQKCVRMCSPSQ